MSRDVLWLKKSFGEYMGIKKRSVTHLGFEEDPLGLDEENDDDNTIKTTNTTETKVTKGFPPHMIRDTAITTLDIALVGAVDPMMDYPESFDEAWNHEDPEEREKWREAILLEFKNMNDRKVWQIVKKEEVPEGKTLIGSRWVFRKKSNGIFRACLVALGYHQVSGIDYTDAYAPVIHDVTLRLVLLMMLTLNWIGALIDIETAFLNGRLEETVFMKIPEGLNEIQPIEDNDCAALEGSLYGLVQAARTWWKVFVNTLVKDFQYTQSQIDSCLLFKR